MVKKYWWVFILGAPLLSILLAGVKVYYSIQVWKYEGPAVTFEVKPGDGFSRINGRLSNRNLISNAKIFHRYAQINDLLKSFKAGQYQIEPGSNMLDIIDTLTKGKSITTSVVIPEGKNLFEIAGLLEAKGITNGAEFIKLAKDESYAKELNIPATRFEGYLYPDTYKFTPKSSPKQVIKIMTNNFHNQVKSLDFSSPRNNLTKHQLIILASVVEKETGASWERPMIAGVFHNRLKKRMRLQSDPTTIYGIYENYKGNLRKRHLQEKTPYNTYRIPALPAGPISNPGLSSLKAVINPAKHDYIYFVSKNDGTHIFTKTYREHLQAVNKFQKSRSARKGKSWRDLKKNKQPQL